MAAQVPESYLKAVLPFEFTVAGPPLSHQTRNRTRLAAWRRAVAAAARSRWPTGSAPHTEDLRMTIVYFHDGVAIRLDNDNMVKPIQDALNGLIYVDDRQILDTVVRKTALDGAFQVRGMSAILAEAFVGGVEFLHVIIDHAPAHAGLLT
jgi:crossover junction endodeoxyribonuclease RusA